MRLIVGEENFEDRIYSFCNFCVSVFDKMAYTSDYIRDKLTEKLAASYVNVVDNSDGCGAKFDVVVVSDMFQGKTLLQRHRLVNSVLEEELKSIHAFSQKTYTNEQWQKIVVAENKEN